VNSPAPVAASGRCPDSPKKWPKLPPLWTAKFGGITHQAMVEGKFNYAEPGLRAILA
jgi:hypothetical protein